MYTIVFPGSVYTVFFVVRGLGCVFSYTPIRCRDLSLLVSRIPLGFCPSQVDKGFDDGTDLGALEEVGFRGKKRARGESPPASVPPRTEDTTRHRAWLDRGSAQGNACSWRPKPVYRVGAKRVLAELDNQVRQSCPLPGLKHFQPCPEKTGPWSCWRTWPHINVTHDLGSDMLCASNAAENEFKLNYTKMPDFDHGCQRSLIEMLKGAGVHEFFLLMVVSWNLPNGPINNDYRYHQLLEATDQCAKVHTARSCVPQGQTICLHALYCVLHRSLLSCFIYRCIFSWSSVVCFVSCFLTRRVPYLSCFIC